jgi:hypothetical protein
MAPLSKYIGVALMGAVGIVSAGPIAIEKRGMFCHFGITVMIFLSIYIPTKQSLTTLQLSQRQSWTSCNSFPSTAPRHTA